MNASFVNEDFNDCSAVKKSQTFKISQLENSVSQSHVQREEEETSEEVDVVQTTSSQLN